MPKTSSKPSTPVAEKPFIVTHTPIVLVLIGLIFFGLFGSLWWTKVHDSPRRVFADMLVNNLSTAGVTRTSSAKGVQNYERVERLSFTPTISNHSYIKISEESEAGKTTVQTETIGTKDNDYSRHLKIDVSQQEGAAPRSFKSVEGVWAKSSLINGQPQYLAQSLQSLVPFANLNAGQRKAILKLIQDKKVYTVNYASTKPKRINGKSAIDFSVSVDPVQYIALLQALNKAVGMDVGDINPDDYKDQPAISLNVLVDKFSRQVLEVTYGQQKEIYTGYGISMPISIPKKTITVEELQQRIQSAQ